MWRWQGPSTSGRSRLIRWCEGTSNVWTLVVPLPPGEHLFMYVVDGTQWITPPLADDFLDDGFGSKNGVVVVLPAAR